MKTKKHKLIAVIIYILAILSASSANAQEQILFHSVDESDGMQDEIVNCLAADDFGYIWIGTQTGLSRYDGMTFTAMSTSNHKEGNAAVGNAISDLAKDKQGNIWIATEKGVSKFNIFTNIFSYVPCFDNDESSHKSNYQADKLYVTQKNSIYLFTIYKHLHKYHTESNQFVPLFEDFFSKHKIRYCHKDLSDNFWMLSEAEHKIYRIDTLGNINLEINCNDFNILTPTKGNYCFLDNSNGEFYFGGDNGMIIYDTINKTFKEIDAINKETFPELETKCFYKDSQGTIWIGTNAKELFRYNPSTKILDRIQSATTRTKYRLNSPTTINICEDSRGFLWFGTWKGLSFTQLSPSKKFHNITNEENSIIPSKYYIACMAARGDTIAIGSDGGGVTFWNKAQNKLLCCFDPQLRNDTKMEKPSVLAVAFDHQGYCYNGGYNRSVTRIHPNLKTVDKYPINLADSTCLQSDFTTDILCDHNNNIWVLTNGAGLHLLEDPDKGIFRRVNTDSKGNHIISLWGACLAEYQNYILIGTYQGISVYDTQKSIFYNYECNPYDTTSLSHNWVYQFLVDSKNRIWVGTSSGLNRFYLEEGKFQRYDRDCGLSSDVIQGLQEDSQTGYLWISTAKGLAKFDPEKGRVLRTYHIADGISTENFMKKSSLKDKYGTIYFGISTGITYFNPSEIKKDTILPMPSITGISINYNAITPQSPNSPLSKAPEATDHIELNYTQNILTIQFTSLNFISEGGNEYTYKLKGYDKDWVDIGTRHEVTFTNLDPGEYVFLVKCHNADGVESDIRPLIIKINAPFYRSWWFVAIEAIIIIGIILLIYHLRTKALIDNQKNLEEKVKSRTEDLVMANTALEIQKQEIEKSLTSTLILNDLSRQITSSFDTHTIITTTYNHVKLIASMDIFAISKYSQSLNTLEYHTIYYRGQQEEPITLPIADSNTAETECFKTNEDIYLHGAKSASSFFKTDTGKPFGTIFALPIREAGKINGVLTIGCLQDNKYTNSDRANIRMIASYMSIALEKAKDYQMLQHKNNAINGSIRYAKTIQDAILVHEDYLNDYFDAMIIFRPKDIVSGDFYWFKTIGTSPDRPQKIFAAVIDCTGHGVPGAFMSLISNILLNDIVIRNHVYEPGQILATLDKEIISALNQEKNLNDDGLDMALCRFDLNDEGIFTRVVYAGAKNSLFHYQQSMGKIRTIHADRISIGGFNNTQYKEFTTHMITPRQGDIFYMSSDGIIDQNNKERKRFGSMKLVQTLTENIHYDMTTQKKLLTTTIDTYMAGTEQRDDITVMGLKIL